MSGKSNEAVQLRKYCDRLAIITQRQHDRIVLMSNTALSFREIIRKFGTHATGCKLSEAEKLPCSCGWADVEKFMGDDSNFGVVKTARESVLVGA